MKTNWEHFMSDQFEADTLQELKRELAEEIAKPERKRDYPKIAELNEAYAFLSGEEAAIEESAVRGMEALKRRPKHISLKRRTKCMMTASAAAIMLLAANIYTVAAYQKDVFSVIVEYTQDSFSVKYTEHEIIELPTTPEDPYGIKAECAKYGLEDVYAPTYLPEGFALGECEHDITKGYCTRVAFYYYRDHRESIVINYKLFENPRTSSSIPSDHFNLTEIQINGQPAIVSKEDEQCSLIFRKDQNLEILMYTEYLDYHESDQIIASLE